MNTAAAGPSKPRVIAEIREYLEGELAEARGKQAANEASELERLLLLYRFLPQRDYSGEGEVIIPSALVELALGQTSAHYFIAPQGGGLITRVDGFPVQVITPQSPLGEALLGKKTGDEVSVAARSGANRVYRVVSVR